MTRIKDNSPKTDSQKNTEAKEPPKKGRGTPRNARGRGKAGKAGNNQPNRRQVNTYSSYRSTLKVWIGELYLEGTQGKINVKFKKPCKIDYFTPMIILQVHVEDDIQSNSSRTSKNKRDAARDNSRPNKQLEPIQSSHRNAPSNQKSQKQTQQVNSTALIWVNIEVISGQIWTRGRRQKRTRGETVRYVTIYFQSL